MIDFYPVIKPFLFTLNPERAHRLALSALRLGCVPGAAAMADPRLSINVFGKTFAHPLGLAAGFDKDAVALTGLYRLGFSFVEAGTVTPHAQGGNPRPRLFRDTTTQSIVNRLGFPGHGLNTFVARVKKFRATDPHACLGINIGINKDAPDAIAAYQAGIAAVDAYADYITVNLSSPNTAGLRDLQAREKLSMLLGGLQSTAPLLLKISPDLDEGACEDVAAVALQYKIAGLVLTNTTVTRPEKLSAPLHHQAGGLSGPLLAPLARQSLARFYRLTGGRIPLIAAGGIDSADEAYARILAGASLLQIYTAFVYQGPAVIARMMNGLSTLLARDGFTSLAAAVGAGQADMKRVI